MMLSALLYFSLLAPDVEKGLVYRKIGDTELKFDLYTPVDAVANGKMVIVIHGGGWVSGTRETMAGICTRLAEIGFTSATITYRLSPAHMWPAHLDDVQSAVRYFRTNAVKYKIDPDLIGATGASAGGHLSLLLGTMDTRDTKTEFYPKVSSRVQAVVNLFGPTDLSKDFNPVVANMLSKQVLGREYDPTDEIVKTFSPINFVDAESAPVFTIHGSADALVPVMQASRMDKAMEKAGKPHELRVIEGMGHEIRIENKECMKAIEESLDWLQVQLKSENGAKALR